MEHLLNWWQHLPAKMNPIIFKLGPLKPQYYGLMYILAFGTTYLLVMYRIRHEKQFSIEKEQVVDLTTYMILGLIIGARIWICALLPFRVLCPASTRNFFAV